MATFSSIASNQDSSDSSAIQRDSSKIKSKSKVFDVLFDLRSCVIFGSKIVLKMTSSSPLSLCPVPPVLKPIGHYLKVSFLPISWNDSMIHGSSSGSMPCQIKYLFLLRRRLNMPTVTQLWPTGADWQRSNPDCQSTRSPRRRWLSCSHWWTGWKKRRRCWKIRKGFPGWVNCLRFLTGLFFCCPTLWKGFSQMMKL